MEPELSPVLLEALRSEVGRLEAERQETLAAYDRRIRDLRRILNGSEPTTSAQAAPPRTQRHVVPPTQPVASDAPLPTGLRGALRVIMGDREMGPVAVYEALRERGFKVPGGDDKLKNRVYVELGKLHREEKRADKRTHEDGSVLYRLRRPTATVEDKDEEEEGD